MGYTQRITPNPAIPCQPGWCLQYVRQAFGLPAVHPTATAAWLASTTQHRDRNFPAGVDHPVWYGLDSEPAGHVVLRMADGSVYSTSDLGSTPHHHPDLADLERYYARYGMKLTYRGWTEDVQGTPVISPRQPQAAQGPPLPAPPKESKKMLIISQAKGSPDIWIGDGIQRRRIPDPKTLEDYRKLARWGVLNIHEDGKTMDYPPAVLGEAVK